MRYPASDRNHRGAASGNVVLEALIVGGLGTALLTGGHSAAFAETNPCQNSATPVTLQAITPSDFSPFGEQLGADCLAWQQFLYLNWQADPANPGHPNLKAPPSSFGTP